MDASISSEMQGSVFSQIRCSVAVLDCWCPRSLFSRAGVPPPRRRVSQSSVISSHTARQSAVIDNQPPAIVSSSERHASSESLSPSPSSLSLATRPSTLPALRSHIKSTRHASVQFIPLNIVPNPLLRFSKIYSIQSSYPCYFIIHHSPPSPTHYFHISNIPSPA